MDKKGLIIKAISGFYYVKTKEKEIFECKARGIFRNKNITPLVGDIVDFKVLNAKKGILEKVNSRKNKFLRPPVANVNQAIIVFSVKDPKPNIDLLDKFLVKAESKNVDAIICINKIDLNEEYYKIKEIYEKAGYKVIKTSTLTNEGINELLLVLKDKKSFFAGPSGVGKSSIINKLQKDFKVEIGEISRKLKRGKHTTRHTELFELKTGGYIFDTPGFTSFSIDEIDYRDLSKYFREFKKHSEYCKFRSCMHINEPKCEIKKLVKEEKISIERYESYKKMVERLKDGKKL